MFIHDSVSRHVVCFHLWLLWILIYNHLFESLFSRLLDVYPEVTLPGHIVILSLIALETRISFSTMIHILFSPEVHVILLTALQRSGLNCFHLLILQQPLLLSFFTGVNYLHGYHHLVGKYLCSNDFFCVLSSLNTSCNLDHYLGQLVIVIPIL